VCAHRCGSASLSPRARWSIRMTVNVWLYVGMLEAQGLPASQLTITVGFGTTLFHGDDGSERSA
jgi:hypothetical protein